MKLTLLDLEALCQQRIEAIFFDSLKNQTTPAPTLQEAMAYSIYNGGKRLRPLLIYVTGYLLNVSWDKLDLPAVAVELIHSYSLIHDDLPAMDNSDLRRGKSTCHKVYGEAVAILAGDALQTLAFELLTSHSAKELSDRQRLDMIQTLCRASGLQGMAAGQTLDIQNIKSFDELKTMYQLKTGALLSACVKLALIAADIKDTHVITPLEQFADAIGLAYQIQDDLLDQSESSGKPKGLDKTNNKANYVAFAGYEAAKETINSLIHQATISIQALGERSGPLLELTQAILHRKK